MAAGVADGRGAGDGAHVSESRTRGLGLEIWVSGGAAAVGVDLYRPAPASGDAHDLAAWMTLSETIQRSPQIVLSELLPAHDALGKLGVESR